VKSEILLEKDKKRVRRLSNVLSRIRHPIFARLAFSAAMLLSCSLPAQAEVVRQFHSDISVKSDTTVNVVELIQVDYEDTERHGITRHIPITMKRHGIPYSVEFKLLSVADESGKPIQYKEWQDGAEIEIKIGNPSITLTGKHTYRIAYRLRRVINFIQGRPELYWNVTGDQWRLPIEKADAEVSLPKNIQPGSYRLAAFQGPPLSTKPAHSTVNQGKIVFSSDYLPPGQGLTIGLSLTPGSITEPTEGERLMWLLRDWWQAIAIPLGTTMFMYLLWFTSGRDQDGGRAIAVEWNPPQGLTPAEVGTLVDERCDLQDITSTLVDLAVRGYLKIEEMETKSFFFLKNKDYRFTKTAPPASDTPLTPAEDLFLAALFSSKEAGASVLLSDLRGSFYPYLGYMKQEIYRRLTRINLFRHNPEQTRGIYFGAALAVACVSLFFFTTSVPTACGLIVASLIIAAFAPAMPAKTAKGSQMAREALGFARFVRKAEKERIRILAEKDPTIFGRMLPYAMVLGAADKWAEAFKDLAMQPPEWYTSSGVYPDYSTTIFVNDLGSSMRSFEQTFTALPSGFGNNDTGSGSGGSSSAWSGGSAFDGGGSGGGFGGGGGDTW
jgi:uncharacterized membrane protein YgcG